MAGTAASPLDAAKTNARAAKRSNDMIGNFSDNNNDGEQHNLT